LGGKVFIGKYLIIFMETKEKLEKKVIDGEVISSVFGGHATVTSLNGEIFWS
jgi:hypothetical protein